MFVRRWRIPRYPERFLPEAPGELRLVHQVDVRPGQFAIGLEEPALKEEWLQGEPVQVAQYLGRVEEVSPSGDVTVTLWERPSGREAMSTLDVAKHFKGNWPRAGDLLHVWTWMELLPGDENPHPRIHIDTETRKLGDSERARLHDLLLELKEGRG
jgi:hypothetical protein